MLKLIRNAIVYKAELPTAEQLEKHLAEMPHHPIGETAITNAGFVTNKTSNELVTTFEGGYSFSLRYDEKILPRAIVKAKADERIAKIEKESGGRLKKVDRMAIYDDVLVELARTALVKTAIITVFYNTSDQLLIVPVGSKRLASIVVGYLIHAVGSVKTSTIHISDIKNGLTTRLKKNLDGDQEAFEGFEVGNQVATVNGSGEKVSYSLDALENAAAGLQEGLGNGFQVERMALSRDGVDFKLTSDFHFKAVKFDGEVERDEAEEADAVFVWRQEASAQVLMFSAVINKLCDLLGYKPETEEQEAA